MASLAHAFSDRAATKAPPPEHRGRARRADDRIEAQFEDEDASDEAPEDFDTDESENDGAEEPEDEELPADDDEGPQENHHGPRARLTTRRWPATAGGAEENDGKQERTAK
jgi:hypothetical protein